MNKVRAVIQTTMVATMAMWGVNQARATLYEVLPSQPLLEGANVTIDGSTEDVSSGGIFIENLTTHATTITVCCDINGTANIGAGQLYEEIPFAGQTGLDPAWGNDGANHPSAAQALNAIQNAAQIYGIYGPAAGLNASAWSAVQLAVWEALYDTGAAGGLNLSTGRFKVNSAEAGVIAAASGELLNGNFAIPGSILVPIDSHGNIIDNFQEFLVDVTPIPEPSTVIAGILLLLPFGASTLRFMRKSRTA